MVLIRVMSEDDEEIDELLVVKEDDFDREQFLREIEEEVLPRPVIVGVARLEELWEGGAMFNFEEGRVHTG